MCGRFATRFTGTSLIRDLSLETVVRLRTELTPRYNIAPTQSIPVLRRAPHGNWDLDLLRWGLVPHWSQGPDSRYAMHNARVEQVEQRPAYRQAFSRRRCLIPADGWYEWRPHDHSPGKQACFIHAPDDAVFCFAGLWERWKAPDASLLESCTIMTTAADPRLAEVHPRMPVVLDPGAWQYWLDPQFTDARALKDFLIGHLYTEFSVTPVSSHVNNAGNDDPRCVEPLRP